MGLGALQRGQLSSGATPPCPKSQALGRNLGIDIVKQFRQMYGSETFRPGSRSARISARTHPITVQPKKKLKRRIRPAPGRRLQSATQVGRSRTANPITKYRKNMISHVTETEPRGIWPCAETPSKPITVSPIIWKRIK
jgi:hypothetical protein